MATSGIYVYQLTRNELITAAAKKLGVIAKGQTLDSNDLADGTQILNRWITLHRGDLPIHNRVEYTFSPTEDVVEYNIGPGQTLNTVHPIKLLQAWSIDTLSGGAQRTPMEIIADYNYNLLPQETSSGQTIQISYQPKIDYGTLKLWTKPDAYVATNVDITIVYNSANAIFVNSTDTMDLPEEWYEALIAGAASLWAPQWGIPLPDRQALKAEAKEYLDLAKEAGQENASLFLIPQRR